VKIADEDAVHIKNFYLLKGWGAQELLNEFPDKGWKLGSIDYLLKKIRKTVSLTDSQAVVNLLNIKITKKAAYGKIYAFSGSTISQGKAVAQNIGKVEK